MITIRTTLAAGYSQIVSTTSQFHEELTNRSLSNRIFRNVSFECSDLMFFDLSNTVFIQCNFKGAFLTQSNMTRASFYHCDFTSASIQKARTLGAKFVDCDFTKSRLFRTSFIKAILWDVTPDNIYIHSLNPIGDSKPCFTSNALYINGNRYFLPSVVNGELSERRVLSETGLNLVDWVNLKEDLTDRIVTFKKTPIRRDSCPDDFDEFEAGGIQQTRYKEKQVWTK